MNFSAETSPHETPHEMQSEGPEKPARKSYHRPTLTLWGDLRDLTMGPSPGIGESGNPALFKA